MFAFVVQLFLVAVPLIGLALSLNHVIIAAWLKVRQAFKGDN